MGVSTYVLTTLSVSFNVNIRKSTSCNRQNPPFFARISPRINQLGGVKINIFHSRPFLKLNLFFAPFCAIFCDCSKQEVTFPYNTHTRYLGEKEMLPPWDLMDSHAINLLFFQSVYLPPPSCLPCIKASRSLKRISFRSPEMKFTSCLFSLFFLQSPRC